MDMSINIHPMADTRAEVLATEGIAWLQIKGEGYPGVSIFLNKDCPREIAQAAADAINSALGYTK